MARFTPILYPQDLPPCAAYPIWVCGTRCSQHHPPALCIYPVLRAGKPSVKRNARVEHPYAVLAIGGKPSSDMFDFSRELPETMATG